jgi:hypothetical protein
MLTHVDPTLDRPVILFQAFLKRIAPLSADLAAHGRPRALALKKLHRICQAEVRKLKASYTPATVKFYLSKYRDSILRR